MIPPRPVDIDAGGMPVPPANVGQQPKRRSSLLDVLIGG
jgi:hypothetical protein